MKHSNMLAKVMMAASKLFGARLFKNQVGCAYTGQTALMHGRKVLFDPRIVRYGLCVGSSDLIGFKSVKIEQPMVGKIVAVFLSVEIKTDGYDKVTKEQQNWIDKVNNAGGIAGVVKTEQDAQVLLERGIE